MWNNFKKIKLKRKMYSTQSARSAHKRSSISNKEKVFYNILLLIHINVDIWTIKTILKWSKQTWSFAYISSNACISC